MPTAGRRARIGVVLLGALSLAGAPVAGAVPTAQATPRATAVAACDPNAGSPVAAGTADFWAQNYLQLNTLRSVSTGAGTTVAVIDSGLSRANPQVAAIATRDPDNVVGSTPSTDVTDCYGHGTAVAAIIAARPGGKLVSVAPGATIMPIKQDGTGEAGAGSGSTRAGTIGGLVNGINFAVQHHANVINLSLTTSEDNPALRAAIAGAGHHGIVVVAAAGNGSDAQQGAQCSPCFPAAYATSLSNVIAVAGVQKNSAPTSSQSGDYISVSAPGTLIAAPALNGSFVAVSGSSFATPYVSGLVALLQARYPGITPGQVRRRLELSADRPAESVPSPHLGYGRINPVQALTAVFDDQLAPPSGHPRTLVPQQLPPPSADHFVRNVALGAGGGMIALAAALLVGLALLRRPRHALIEVPRR